MSALACSPRVEAQFAPPLPNHQPKSRKPNQTKQLLCAPQTQIWLLFRLPLLGATFQVDRLSRVSVSFALLSPPRMEASSRRSITSSKAPDGLVLVAGVQSARRTARRVGRPDLGPCRWARISWWPLCSTLVSALPGRQSRLCGIDLTTAALPSASSLARSNGRGLLAPRSSPAHLFAPHTNEQSNVARSSHLTECASLLASTARRGWRRL